MAHDDSEHPGLGGYSRTWEQAKHVIGKTLKFAAWGAAITGALMLLSPVGGIASAIGAVSGLFGSGTVAGGIGSALIKTLVVGAVPGAVIGGALGLAKGIGGAGNAADDEEERRVAAYERREVRNERKEMLAMQRAHQGIALAREAQATGISPGMMFGKGQGSQRGL